MMRLMISSGFNRRIAGKLVVEVGKTKDASNGAIEQLRSIDNASLNDADHGTV